MALAEEERCATCGSGDPRKPGRFLDETCVDPYHAAAWNEHLDEIAEAPRVLGIGITNADGLTSWMGSYSQTARPAPDYDAVSVWPVDR